MEALKLLLGLCVDAFLLVLYMLPTFYARDKKHLTGICVLNIATGWTFVGWVGALVWAVSDEKKAVSDDPRGS